MVRQEEADRASGKGDAGKDTVGGVGSTYSFSRVIKTRKPLLAGVGSQVPAAAKPPPPTQPVVAGLGLGGYDSDDGAAFCHTVSSHDYGRMPTTQLRHLVICGGNEGLEFNLLLDPGTPTG